jgi:hypothetical protein
LRRRPGIFRREFLLIVAALPVWFFGVFGSGVAWGLQELGSEGSGSETMRSSGQEAVDDGARLLLQTESGELIPLRDLLGDDALSSLLRRAGEQRLPGYWIARLELRGKVAGELVELELDLQVMVRAKSEWVAVPLSFGDVYLTDFSHETEVEGGESVLGRVEQNQRRWSLRGAGLHRLKIHLSGRTRAGVPGVHQLNLTLPEAAASHAVFEFSGPVEFQRLPAGAVDRQTRDERGVRSAEFVGLSGAVGFAWSEVAPAVAVTPVIQVQNRMKLDLTTIPASLTGTQQLRITGAGLSEVRVRWPEGFELKEVQARNSGNISVLNNYEVSEESGVSTALIRFTGSTEGPLVLEYGLERSNRSFPQEIRVSLPVVEGANIQTGDLDLIFPAGMLVQQAQIVGAQRRRVTAEADPVAAATAFRLRSPESFILIDVAEMAAQYAETTELRVRPQGSSVVLAGEVRVNVLRGALQELLVEWQPGAAGSDWSEWSLLPGGARLIRDSKSIPLTPELLPGEAGGPSILRFMFPERQSGEFAVEFQAISELPSDISGGSAAGSTSGPAQGGGGAGSGTRGERRLLLAVPQVQGRRGQSVVLRAEDSDEYQAELLNSVSGERLRMVPAGSVSGGVVGAGDVDDRGTSWVHESPEEPVWIRLTPQRQLIRAAVTAGLSVAASGVEIRESIELEVMHRDVSEVTLMVPDSVQPVVRAAGVSEPLRAVIGKSNEWTFRLPQPTRGTLQLEVRWLRGLNTGMAGGGVMDLDLPLVLPRDARVWRLQAGTNESGLEVREDMGWDPVYSERFESAWSNSEWSSAGSVEEGDELAGVSGGRVANAASLPLRYRRLASGGSGAAPMLLLTDSRVFRGQALTSCHWYFERRPERLVIEVPAGLALESMSLGATSLTSDPGLIQAREDRSRGIVEWEVFPRVLRERIADSESPLVLRVRMRQELGAARRWLEEQELQRVRLRGETEATVMVWLVRPQEGLRTVISNSPLTSLSAVPARLFRSEAGAAEVSLRQLGAVVSAFPKEIRESAMSEGGEWLGSNGAHELCFGGGADGAVRLRVMPESMLFLVTAVLCLIVFVMLTVLPGAPAGLPIPLAAAALTGGWVISPEWSGLLLPWCVAGVVGGVGAAGLQRWAVVRKYGVSPLRRVTERPTVFGFPNYADSGLRQLNAGGGGAAAGQVEAGVG